MSKIDSRKNRSLNYPPSAIRYNKVSFFFLLSAVSFRCVSDHGSPQALFSNNVHPIQGSQPLKVEGYYAMVHEHKKKQEMKVMELCRKEQLIIDLKGPRL